MDKPNKICRIIFPDNIDTREDGLPFPKSRYIAADPDGDPDIPYLWDGPFPETPVDPEP